ncbi:MAG: hypothetical protein HQK53_20225 [Oligoflexia bacterium]|nr:hypothetical protein [Oligoflexia bacterium]
MKKIILILSVIYGVVFSFSVVNAADAGPSASTGAIASVTGIGGVIQFESYVYVPIDADNNFIDATIARQIKTAIGALDAAKISFNDAHNLLRGVPRSEWRREIVEISNSTQRVQRVRYRFRDNVVASKSLRGRESIDVTLLANDYSKHAERLMADCAVRDLMIDEFESFWYFFHPEKESCQKLINDEAREISINNANLDDNVISSAEANRWFITITARLFLAPDLTRELYPKYHRIYDIYDQNNYDHKIVIYVFTGSDLHSAFANDRLGIEHIRFLRRLLMTYPGFRPDTSNLLDISIDDRTDDRKVEGVTYERLFNWVLEGRDYPPEIAADKTKIYLLQTMVMKKFAEKWIYWDFPITVNSKKTTIEIRTYYGNEDGSEEARNNSKMRYLEAFKNGDVVIYNGHSHMGESSLSPSLYKVADFKNSYQILFFNSCSSYCHYHQGFFDLKPGREKELDIVVNGLRSNILNSGEVVSSFLFGILEMKSYENLLADMQNVSHSASDELRLASCTLDDSFSQVEYPLQNNFFSSEYFE